MYDIVIRYEDGHRSSTRARIDDLGKACAYVLRLADQLGNAADMHAGSPKWVEIYHGDHLEISVSVVGDGPIRPKAV